MAISLQTAPSQTHPQITTPYFISGLARHMMAPSSSSSSSASTPLLMMMHNLTQQQNDNDNENVNSSRLEFPELDPIRSVAIALPLILICLCTVCGNLLVLLAVITTRKLRTATNYFIVNLAIADMMLGITVLPFSTTIEILDEFWIFGQALCDMWVTIDVLCCTASIYGLCVISIDRYIGVSKPLVHNQIVNKQRAILINLGVWLLSAAICVVPFFGWRKSLPVESTGRCEVNEDRAYVIFSATCSFFLPCTVVMLVYWRIYLKAVQQTRFMKLGYKEAKMTSKGTENGVVLRIHTGAIAGTNATGGQTALRLSVSKRESALSNDIASAIDSNLRQRKIDWTKFKRERRAARTLGIVVGVFIACWVPFFVILPTNAFCECLPPQLFKVVFWLGYCNSLMNPFIYGADSREFQAAFKRLLCGKKSLYSSAGSQPGTPRGPGGSTMMAKTRRQLLSKTTSTNQNGNRTAAANNGLSYLKANFDTNLPPPVEESESFPFDDGMSTTECLRPARSTTSLNRTVVANGLLAVPLTTSNLGASQPLLADFRDENEAVENSLRDEHGHSAVIVSKPDEVPVQRTSLSAATRGVSTSTSSLKTLYQPVKAPLAEQTDTEPETPVALTRSAMSHSASVTPLKLAKVPEKATTMEPPQPPPTTTGSSAGAKSSPIVPMARHRVTSISSLSTLSSPSDSDDEEMKQKKRASREHKRKKHFNARKSMSPQYVSPASKPLRTPSGLRRLSEFWYQRAKRNSSNTAPNVPRNSAADGTATALKLNNATSASSSALYSMNYNNASSSPINNSGANSAPTNVTPRSRATTPAKRSMGASIQIPEHNHHIASSSSSVAAHTPEKSVTFADQRRNDDTTPVRRRADDLASLAVRRLLMIRFAKRVRAKSKARSDACDVMPPDHQNVAAGNDEQQQQQQQQQQQVSSNSPSTALRYIKTYPLKNVQTLAPQSRWRNAISKITSSSLSTTPSKAAAKTTTTTTTPSCASSSSPLNISPSIFMAANMSNNNNNNNSSHFNYNGKSSTSGTVLKQQQSPVPSPVPVVDAVITVVMPASSKSSSSHDINNANKTEPPMRVPASETTSSLNRTTMETVVGSGPENVFDDLSGTGNSVFTSSPMSMSSPPLPLTVPALVGLSASGDDLNLDHVDEPLPALTVNHHHHHHQQQQHQCGADAGAKVKLKICHETDRCVLEFDGNGVDL